MIMAKHQSKNNARRTGRRPARGRRGFILILVLVVVAFATLAAFTFTAAMMLAKEDSMISVDRLRARMCAESGLQAVRLFVAQPRQVREELGGDWDNDMFYARNVIASPSASGRGNYTLLAPSLGTFGEYEGLRYGLQNESAKLNLNALAQIDAMGSSGDLGAAAGGGGDDLTSTLASAATESVSGDIASTMLMALPGMTVDVADSILDWLDEDNEPREYGAEFDDYYGTLPSPYRPANGPIASIEQLLLVRGVTPQMLFGFDQDRNGLLDDQESQMMNSMLPNSGAGGGEADSVAPPPLGWAAYMTLHSMEKNATGIGDPRININSDDLETLYSDLTAVLGDDTLASFIVAYRQFGKPGGNGTSPLVTLASMSMEESDPGGALGSQLDTLSALSGAGGGGGNEQTIPWTSDLLANVDMTQGGSVTFSQVLDLFGATVTIQQGNQSRVYASPLGETPGELALSTPLVMDALTTVDAPGVPGRINIMLCPQEVLRGIPGLTDEVVDQIIEARVDGSESETRQYETWLAVEGYVTMDQMRAILPLVTCGGDVYKAQIVGYIEGNTTSARIEAIVSGVDAVPRVQFFRRFDHLGRGADITTLGQRFDATVPGASM
ncbi:MAG: type II secretion system protein GspK [Aureliella sp.]